MRARATPPSRDRERMVATFVKDTLGHERVRVARLHSFTSNEVYEVDADEHRFVLKASKHHALRAEVWACSHGARAGCRAPAILAFGALDDDTSAFVMERATGEPIRAGHSAHRDVGTLLRPLHDVTRQGFGWLAEASWQEHGEPSLAHDTWLSFLTGICGATRHLSPRYPFAASIAEAAAAAIDARADEFAGVRVGSLCHGDLKRAHVLVGEQRVTAVIDWGDAAVGDPIWDIARFAQRLDARSLRLLLEGYDPDATVRDALASRLPVYGALWMLVDAIVDHRLGGEADPLLAAAMEHLGRVSPPATA